MPDEKYWRATIGACLLMTAALAVGGCNRSPSPGKPGESKPSARNFRAVHAELSPWERTIRAFGTLAAHDQATVSTKVAGQLEAILVDLGDAVRTGQIIAQIDQRDYKLQVQQAEATLAQARVRLGLPLDGEDDSITPEDTSAVRQSRAVLEEARAHRDRVRSLSDQQILAASEVETAEANYVVALSRHQDSLDNIRTQQALVAQRRAELEIARQHLENTTIRAPFDGSVQERRANAGEYLPASAPILALVRTDPLRLRIEVAERDASLVAIGQRVRLALQGTTNIHTGEIKRLSPALDEKSRMLRIEADVSNRGGLRPGSFVTAEIVINDADPAVTVPLDSIVSFAGVERVFVVESGSAVERIVTTGRRTGGRVEILTGVKTGEIVLLNPGSLRSGAAVIVTIDPPPRDAHSTHHGRLEASSG